jgi:hypothetical protein
MAMIELVDFNTTYTKEKTAGTEVKKTRRQREDDRAEGRCPCGRCARGAEGGVIRRYKIRNDKRRCKAPLVIPGRRSGQRPR